MKNLLPNLAKGDKMDIMVQIEEIEYTLESLKADCLVAKKKGLSHKFAFTPETVMGLIAKIEELEEERIYKEISQDFYNDY